MDAKETRKNRFHFWLFNRLAYFYQWFYTWQIKKYEKVIAQQLTALNLPPNAKILDDGCGTGAFGNAFKKFGFDVLGIDVAPNMMKKAKKNNLECIQGDMIQGLDFSNQSFDLVIGAYVLHGLRKESRKSIYREASRLSRGKVIFQDYSTKRMLHTTIVEWIEHGDYFNFIKSIPKEFQDNFSSVQVAAISSQAAWYICQGA